MPAIDAMGTTFTLGLHFLAVLYCHCCHQARYLARARLSGPLKAVPENLIDWCWNHVGLRDAELGAVAICLDEALIADESNDGSKKVVWNAPALV